MPTSPAFTFLSRLLLALACLFLILSYCEARKTEAEHKAAEDHAWLKWKAEHEKNYSAAEEPQRRANWAAQYHGYKALKKQKAFTKGLTDDHGETYRPFGEGGPNGLADLTEEEAEAIENDLTEMTEEEWHEFEQDENYVDENFEEEAIADYEEDLESSDEIEAEFGADEHRRIRRQKKGDKGYDWRTNTKKFGYSLVSRVKHQGGCGTCWSFSVTAAVEAQLANVTGRRAISLSNQHIINCNKKFKDKCQEKCSCGGNTEWSALKTISQHGLASWDNLPYQEPHADRTCPTDIKNELKGYKLKYGEVKPKNNEEALRKALMKYGPIMAGMAYNDFKEYTKQDGIVGIDKPSKFCDENPNKNTHAILIVGYGTEGNGKDYWIIKNTYGKSWGHNGYMLLARNRNNYCSIAKAGIFLTLQKV